MTNLKIVHIRSGPWSCLTGLVFTAGCTTMQSTVLLSHVVCLSIRLSVTLVDHDHIGWKSWKLTARTISPTSSLFVPKDNPPTPTGTWRNFGETRGGVEKSGVLEHKSGNSLKRVKVEEKLLWKAYRKSPTLFRFFGSSPYFYFRFRLYGHWDSHFCLIFVRIANSPAIGTRW